MPHLWGIDVGVTQLEALGLQKSKLLELLLVLPLRHLPSPTLHGELVLKKGDLTSKAFGIFTSRG
jgi:hypothetical protein